ncbi:MAG: nickel-dependent hydrogenase large subunit, partial [Actinomycetes bacterium]
MTTYQVDPISRIEGHLGVKVTTGGAGVVTEADVHGNLWRGFENFLLGRVPNDAITFTQRICGVCPVPHGMTSTFAVEAALGYNQNFQTFLESGTAGVPAKALHVRNLILGSEFLMSSLTHFYHLAAPSYVQGPAIPPWTPYFASGYYHTALRSAGHGITASGLYASGDVTRQGALPALGTVDGGAKLYSDDLWSAVINQYVKALRIRRLTFEAGALFSGRMPMTSALIAGGIGFNNEAELSGRIAMFQGLTQEVGKFVIQEYVPLVLALGSLYTEYDNVNNGAQYTSTLSTSSSGYGGGCGNFLAWGGFPTTATTGGLALSRGYMRTGLAGASVSGTADWFGATTGPTALAITTADVQANLREDITHSRYTSGAGGLYGYTSGTGGNVAYPGAVSRTIPLRSVEAKYSWLKAPRWNGFPMEVGPMARMFVMGLFKNNIPLVNSVSGAFVGYPDYAKTTTNSTGSLTFTGLNPKMINPDLGVAC